MRSVWLYYCLLAVIVAIAVLFLACCPLSCLPLCLFAYCFVCCVVLLLLACCLSAVFVAVCCCCCLLAVLLAVAVACLLFAVLFRLLCLLLLAVLLACCCCCYLRARLPLARKHELATLRSWSLNISIKSQEEPNKQKKKLASRASALGWGLGEVKMVGTNENILSHIHQEQWRFWLQRI